MFGEVAADEAVDAEDKNFEGHDVTFKFCLFMRIVVQNACLDD
jgi:hypothetical protein